MPPKMGRFVGFLARHERSQRLDDGLVHMFSPTHNRYKMLGGGPPRDERGWAAFCAPGLSHNRIPGETTTVASTPITCVRCLCYREFNRR